MKRRFDFRLERVARIRELQEHVARAERASAENLARAAEARRDQARSVLRRSRAWLGEILGGRCNPRLVLSSQVAMDLELKRLARAHETARTLRSQAERAAAVHRARRSAARALEELRERARARHGEALQREENSALDEAALRSRGKKEADSRLPPPRTDHGDAS